MRLSWLRLFWAGLVIAGAIVGYLVSSGLGERLLHREIETQLSRLLAGPVRVADVEFHFERGLRFEARQLEAYPGAEADDIAALRARRVIARINAFALLIGRLELSALVLEAPHLRLEETADGRFRGLPFPAFDAPLLWQGSGSKDESAAEAFARRIERIDQFAETFFENLGVADRIEIQDGTLHWIGQSTTEPAPSIRLELVHTVIESDWLSDAASLDWRAVFVDGQHAPFPFEAHVARAENEPFSWQISFFEIPLATAETPLAFIEGIKGLEGRLTTELRINRSAGGQMRAKLTGEIEDGIIGLRRSGASLERGKIRLDADLLVHPNRIELRRAHLEDAKLGLELAGTIDRPLRATSRTHLETRMVGFDVEDVITLVRSLETDSDAARSLSRLIERVEGGHILSVAASGDAPWRDWTALTGGRSNELPQGLRFGAAFEDLVVATGPGDRIENLRGQVEWADDRLTLRDATGSFRGAAMPRLHLALNGTTAIGRVARDSGEITTQPPAVPGLEALIEILEPKNPESLPPIKLIGLAIDHLEHPVFRWPLHDLRLLIEPLRRGLEVNIQDGTWGGVGISGEMVWFADPQGSTLSVELDLSDGRPPTSPISPEKMTPSDANDARWAKGQFELEFRPRPKLPFQKTSGFFRLDGTRLVGNEVNFVVEPTGQLATRMVLDLAEQGRVGTELSFALTDGRFEHVSEFIALRPGLVRGALGATGTLRGPIRPDEPLIGELDGSVRVEAQNGKIRTEIPLLLRLSRASEGYNPFADEDELKYETMSATIAFDQGVLSADDFEIEGPLRIFARGRIDPFANPADVSGLVGLFLFRAPNQILGNLPLVKYFLPGSERGLIGAYFRVEGALAEPDVETLQMASLMSGVPEALKAPFKVLQYLFDLQGDD